MISNIFSNLFFTSTHENRDLELDVLRGIAIIMMIVFHLLFDLNYFKVWGISVDSGFWWFFGRLTAVIFLFLVGISLSIYFARIQHQKHEGLLKKLLLFRGFKVFGWGLVITLLSFWFLPQGAIWFGVLHFIGVSVMLSCFFVRFKKLNLILGVAFILIGLFLLQFSFSFPYLLWLGFSPVSFYSFDYFPLLPWFGLVLIGLFFGKVWYKNGESPFHQKIQSNFKKNFFIQKFAVLGQYSLFIYLVHQPILIAILIALGVSIPFI